MGLGFYFILFFVFYSREGSISFFGDRPQLRVKILARDHISPLAAQLCSHRDQRESGLSPSLSPHRIRSREPRTV